jgi:hypothetical protein
MLDDVNGGGAGVEDLHGNAVFLPSTYLRASAERIGLMSLALYACHALSYLMLKRIYKGKKSDDSPSSKEDRPKLLSYYFVHLVGAAVLAGYGLCVYPFQPDFSTLESRDKIAGFVQMIPFGELQIAYQVWGLPAGILFVPERWSMKMHHTIVIFLGIVVACFNNGCRFYAPFFFGIVELSSVPLSVMNILKHDKRLQDDYPILKPIASAIFATSFLYIRVYLLLQNIWDFSKMVVALMMSCPGESQGVEQAMCMAPYLGTLVLSVLLTSLQIVWAVKIVQMLLKMAGLTTKDKKDKQSKKA